MSFEQVGFGEVFDGSVSFAPIVILQSSLPHLVCRQHFVASEGTDGLDDYGAMPVTLDRGTGDEVRFALWRRRGNPQDTFAVHAPAELTATPGLVDRMVAALGLERGPRLWPAPGQPVVREQTVPFSSMF